MLACASLGGSCLFIVSQVFATQGRISNIVNGTRKTTLNEPANNNSAGLKAFLLDTQHRSSHQSSMPQSLPTMKGSTSIARTLLILLPSVTAVPSGNGKGDLICYDQKFFSQGCWNSTVSPRMCENYCNCKAFSVWECNVPTHVGCKSEELLKICKSRGLKGVYCDCDFGFGAYEKEGGL